LIDDNRRSLLDRPTDTRLSVSPSIDLIGNAENTGLEHAGPENAGPESARPENERPLLFYSKCCFRVVYVITS